MGLAAVNGAMLQCTFGTGPVPMAVIPTARVFACNQPAATIQDHTPLVNIPPLGMCSNPANPMVAAATAAAMGVLTPVPCVPVTPAPWTPGVPAVLIGGQPALDNSSKLTCVYGGVISIQIPGQFTVLY